MNEVLLNIVDFFDPLTIILNISPDQLPDGNLALRCQVFFTPLVTKSGAKSSDENTTSPQAQYESNPFSIIHDGIFTASRPRSKLDC